MTDHRPTDDAEPASASSSPTEPDDVPATVPANYRVVPLTADLLLDTALLRSVAGVVLGVLVLVWPSRTNAALGVLVGVGFVLFSTFSLVDGARRDRPRPDMVLSAAGLALGILLILDIGNAHSNVGRLVGVGLIGGAVHQLTRRRGTPRRETTAVAAAYTALGLLALAFPDQVISTATSIVAALWVVVGLIAIATTLDARRPGTIGYTGAVEAIRYWLDDRSATIDRRDELADRLTFAGAGAPARMVRYLVLMAFASLIASGRPVHASSPTPSSDCSRWIPGASSAATNRNRVPESAFDSIGKLLATTNWNGLPS